MECSSMPTGHNLECVLCIFFHTRVTISLPLCTASSLEHLAQSRWCPTSRVNRPWRQLCQMVNPTLLTLHCFAFNLQWERFSLLVIKDLLRKASNGVVTRAREDIILTKVRVEPFRAGLDCGVTPNVMDLSVGCFFVSFLSWVKISNTPSSFIRYHLTSLF